ncbi:MAG TPA: VOC family protein [Candidatus Acidoferrum sp.]|nr:VOC family protein [Candidatus Acidoferrum sp.]
MITGFNHTSFTVPDLDRALRFWTEALGFRIASVGERSGDWQARVTGVPGARLRVAHLDGHGHHMEFIQYLSGTAESPRYEPNMAGAAHVCLEVTDIHRTAARLLAAGATLQGEMAEVTTGVAVGGWAGYIRDPNGIIIELYEPAATTKSP